MLFGLFKIEIVFACWLLVFVQRRTVVLFCHHKSFVHFVFVVEISVQPILVNNLHLFVYLVCQWCRAKVHSCKLSLIWRKLFCRLVAFWLIVNVPGWHHGLQRSVRNNCLVVWVCCRILAVQVMSITIIANLSFVIIPISLVSFIYFFRNQLTQLSVVFLLLWDRLRVKQLLSFCSVSGKWICVFSLLIYYFDCLCIWLLSTSYGTINVLKNIWCQVNWCSCVRYSFGLDVAITASHWAGVSANFVFFVLLLHSLPHERPRIALGPSIGGHMVNCNINLLAFVLIYIHVLSRVLNVTTCCWNLFSYIMNSFVVPVIDLAQIVFTSRRYSLVWSWRLKPICTSILVSTWHFGTPGCRDNSPTNALSIILKIWIHLLVVHVIQISGTCGVRLSVSLRSAILESIFYIRLVMTFVASFLHNPIGFLRLNCYYVVCVWVIWSTLSDRRMYIPVLGIHSYVWVACSCILIVLQIGI